MTKKEIEIQTALGTMTYIHWLILYGIVFKEEESTWYFPILPKYKGKLRYIVSIGDDHHETYYTISHITIKHMYKHRYYSGKVSWPGEGELVYWTEKQIAEKIIENVYKDIIGSYDYPELEIKYDG